MNQSTLSDQATKLKVDSVETANPLLIFYGAGYDLMASHADVELPLNVLAQSANYHEYWSDGEDVAVVAIAGLGHVKTRASKNHLVLIFDCNDIALHNLVFSTYESAYRIGTELGYQHLLRTWNYIDRINEVEKQEERYQTFCVARHEALAQLGKLDLPHPAATAIGGHHGKNVFVFLFAKEAGRVIENKRQVSAWKYPKQYAPKQPRFSRAMKCGSLLMCSGTASVIGHKTKHLNDVAAQFDECLKNVSVLLSEDDIPHEIKAGIYRFYLREVEHAPLVEAKILKIGIQKYTILHSDVCRENLLIECEVVFQ